MTFPLIGAGKSKISPAALLSRGVASNEINPLEAKLPKKRKEPSCKDGSFHIARTICKPDFVPLYSGGSYLSRRVVADMLKRFS